MTNDDKDHLAWLVDGRDKPGQAWTRPAMTAEVQPPIRAKAANGRVAPASAGSQLDFAAFES
jgi:hypothetical protein